LAWLVFGTPEGVPFLFMVLGGLVFDLYIPYSGLSGTNMPPRILLVGNGLDRFGA